MAINPKKSDSESGPIDIIRIEQEIIEVYVLGMTPLLFHSMAMKAKRELIFPHKKNEAERAASVKHDPAQEFRDSVDKAQGKAEARLQIPATAFKGAILTAALRTPGSTKTEVGQLVTVEGDNVLIYGTPKLHMAVVRMADMKRTPDLRTRACCIEWCAKLRIRLTRPLMTATAVVNLLANGGLVAGVGDNRPEKGKGSNGQFVLVGKDDADWQRIASTEGRVAQDEALAHPVAYDEAAHELWQWCEAETARRGRDTKAKKEAVVITPAQPRNGHRNGEARA